MLRATKAEDVESASNSLDRPPDDIRHSVSNPGKLDHSLSLIEESSPAVLQARKSTFMITRVVAKSDGDSVEDLDDVTNTEEASSVAEVTHNQWSSVETVHSPCELTPRSPLQADLTSVAIPLITTNCTLHRMHTEMPSAEAQDVQSRFRIVKLESRTPFLRGRWTCMDFIDPPSTTQTNLVSNSHNVGSDADYTVPPPIYFVDNFPGAAFTPAFVYCSDGLPVLERNPLKSLVDGNYDTVVSVDKSQSGLYHSSLNKNVPSDDSDKASAVNCIPSILVRRQSDLSVLSNPANILILPDNSNNSDSATGTFAIDNKIEQAMDLVKSHLMFAVHEEVEVLKEKIKELTVKNAKLEYENDVLRAAASPDILARLDATSNPPALSKPSGQPSSGAPS